MKFRSIRAAATIAVGVTALLGTAFVAVPANAASPTPEAPKINASQQASYEAQVTKFQLANPAPTNQPGSTDAAYAKFKTDVTAYWKRVPWAAVYGQWGCTVSSVEQSQQLDGDGVVNPTLVLVTDCSGASSLAQTLAGAVEPRSATEAARGNASSSSTQAVAAAAPRYCKVSYPLRQCLGTDFVGDIYARSSYGESGKATLTVRLGMPPGAGCAQGTLKAQSPPTTVSGTQEVTVHSTTNVNRQWSNSTKDFTWVTVCAFV